MLTLARIKNDVFFRQSAVYFIGSMVVAALNYLLYPVLGRLLTPSDFGDVQVFMSLIAQAGILFTAFSIVVVNITANTEQKDERTAILAELRKACFLIVGAAFIFLLFFISRLSSFFNLYSMYPLLGLAAVLLLNTNTIFRSSYLQGMGRFTELSLSGIISSGGRVLLAVLLIVLGMGSFGAISGIVLAQCAALVFLMLRTKGIFVSLSPTDIHVLEKGSIKKEIWYGFLVLFASGLVTFIYTSDVLVVKHFFNAHDAGLYSGISAIAKILFFLVAPISAVLLSSVKIKNTEKENSVILFKSLGISLCLGGAVLIAFLFFSDTILNILLGETYLRFAYMLPKIGLVMFLSAIINIFVYYFLALRRLFLIGLSCLGIVVTALLLVMNHGSIDAVVTDLVISLLILITLFVIIYAKSHFNRHTGVQ